MTTTGSILTSVVSVVTAATVVSVVTAATVVPVSGRFQDSGVHAPLCQLTEPVTVVRLLQYKIRR